MFYTCNFFFDECSKTSVNHGSRIFVLNTFLSEFRNFYRVFIVEIQRVDKYESPRFVERKMFPGKGESFVHNEAGIFVAQICSAALTLLFT
ncbi:hypothetical protein WN51_07081 [Melipona quadrifasciata]|uniref:Uncharacterized protein n=1 Tax=Melipona quadrifasciata TaxID=166423 RepID=A0A0M8ZRT9_9HYME|nr:hypothetical protein WN51_07081 [Melipona quadrifasciata]